MTYYINECLDGMASIFIVSFGDGIVAYWNVFMDTAASVDVVGSRYIPTGRPTRRWWRIAKAAVFVVGRGYNVFNHRRWLCQPAIATAWSLACFLSSKIL